MSCTLVSKTLNRIVSEKMDLDIDFNSFEAWRIFMSHDNRCKARIKTIKLNATKRTYSDLMASISLDKQMVDNRGSSRFEEFRNLEFLSIERVETSTVGIPSVSWGSQKATVQKPCQMDESLQRSFVGCLSELKKITRLEMVQCNLCDDSVSDLSAMIHLTHLDLSINYITGEGLRTLSPLAKLMHLSLRESLVDGSHRLDTLSHLKRLTHLDLSYNMIDGSSVAHLNGLDELTNLDLSHNDIQDTAGFVGFKKLSRLSLRNNSIDNIHSLCSLPLTDLDVSDNRIGERIPMPLEFHSLTFLCISGNELTDEHAAFIGSISSLEYLDISSNLIGTKVAERILSMPNLDWLDLSLNNIDFGTLPQVSKFKCLHIHEQDQEGTLFVDSIGRCDSLREFSVSYWKIGNEGALIMSALLQLTKVEVVSCGLTKEGAMYLSNLKHLIKLDISLNAITDDGVDYLCSMKKLKSLNLSKCSITNQSLVHVSRLPCLRTLDLSWNSIGNYGIIYLKDMSTLVNLDLSYTRVSESGLCFLDGLTGIKRLCLEHTACDNWKSIPRNGPKSDERPDNESYCSIL